MKKKKTDDPFEGLTKRQKEEIVKETEKAFEKTTRKVARGLYTTRKYPE